MPGILLDDLPVKLKKDIKKHIANLKESIYQEGGDAFLNIISEYASEQIYSLALYYNAGSWSYLSPTFSTERGLEETVEDYSKKGYSEDKESLRWSPCDSPHHGTYESFMPETEEALTSLTRLTSDASHYLEAQGLEDDISIVCHMHQLIHDSVIKSLRKIALIPEIKEFRAKHDTLIMLDAGDLDSDILENDIVVLNGKSALKRYYDWENTVLKARAKRTPRKALDATQKKQLKLLINALKEAVLAEGLVAFKHIITSYTDYDIYCLSMYYDPNNWSCLEPRYSSEQGLQQTTNEYAEQYHLSEEHFLKIIRWQPEDATCSLGEDVAASFMQQTNSILTDINTLLEALQDPIGETQFVKKTNAQIKKEHKKIHRVVVEALVEIVNQPDIQAYCNSHSCAVALLANKLKEEDILSEIECINNKETYQRVAREHELAYIASRAWAKMSNKFRPSAGRTPPKIKLTLRDFEDIIESFSPTLEVTDGYVHIKRSWGFERHRRQDYHNDMKLDWILQKSKHYAEIEPVIYTSYTGNYSYKATSLIPQIARALTIKLGSILKEQFPTRSFYTYMIVGADVDNSINFYENLKDGYRISDKHELEYGGFSETRYISSTPLSLIVPVALYKDDDCFIAHATGFEEDSSSSKEDVGFVPRASWIDDFLANPDGYQLSSIVARSCGNEGSYALALSELKDKLDTYFSQDDCSHFVSRTDEFNELWEADADFKNSTSALDGIERWDYIELYPKFLSSDLHKE